MFRKVYKRDYYIQSETNESDSINDSNDEFAEFKNMYTRQCEKSWDDEITAYSSSPRAGYKTNVLQWWSTKLHLMKDNSHQKWRAIYWE